MNPEDVLPWLLEFPLTILAIYLNMQLIASEKENRTLEVMFTTAGSRYKVWLLRLGTLNLLLLILAVFLGVFAFFTFADIEILGTAVHGFIPAYFVGAMTLFFSVKFRSGFAAGMVAAGIVTLTFMFTEAIHDTRYFLYFNPFYLPRRLDPETWNLWMWQNRIALLILGMVLQFFALRGLEDRERLLR
jgi:ABC-type transport system involved in multi-copper enzyme maturation permease subunit